MKNFEKIENIEDNDVKNIINNFDQVQNNDN